jgi:hypothetical protein
MTSFYYKCLIEHCTLKNIVRQIFHFVNNHRVWLYNVSKQKVMGSSFLKKLEQKNH